MPAAKVHALNAMPTLRRKREAKSPDPPVRGRSGVEFEEILESLQRSRREYEPDFLRTVYEHSAEMHSGQRRESGEPYLTHPLYVGWLLAEWRFDAESVAAGLLHDVIEDTLTTREALSQEFDEEIADLVDGVTKIGQHEYVRRDEAQAQTFRKLILASVEDPRVVIIKLADRLHNMLTLEHLTAESRRRIAQETLEIYAPIAQRLGMSRVQGDLEDLAFYHLYPLQYEQLHKELKERIELGREMTESIRSEMSEVLQAAELEAEISFRVKRYYSIQRKLRRLGIDISQLYDYLAFRVIAKDVRECYAVLGVMHQKWRPMPGRFKDYIAMPKPNLYQSLHTTLVGPKGQPFEIQIRTHEMDQIAEEGIAAHWRYKEGSLDADQETDPNIVWLRQLLEWQQEVEDPRTFLNALKMDLYPDEVYVFTPNGDVLSFPRGATPVDFAYRVHTELGHQCAGARVNGKLVPLRTKLENGDMVEVITNVGKQPTQDWLSFVVTSKAKSKIRSWLTKRQKERSMELGRKLLDRELKRAHVSAKKLFGSDELEAYMQGEGIADEDALLARVGMGKLEPRVVLEQAVGTEASGDERTSSGRIRQAMRRILPSGESPIAVKGHSDMLVHLAKCCKPLPGEEIVGYVTRGRGVSVHAADCSNVKKLLYDPEREIEVEWSRSDEGIYPVVLLIQTEDHPGMLAKLTETIAKHDSNIRRFDASTEETGEGRIQVVVEVRNAKHFTKLRTSLRELDGVLAVGRQAGRGSSLDEG